MTTARWRHTSLVTVMGLLLTIVVVAPADAGTAVSRGRTAERYALSLLNCTRTGGWVTANGTCIGRGSGRYSAPRQPLRLHRGISQRVAWPWARTLATKRICAHSLAGAPDLGRRLRRAGFRYHYFGENLGCGYGVGAKGLVLATHRMMQAEQRSNGGHWRNIKNRGYKSVGIGVAIRDGTIMVVYDFYGKRY
jgi:hypothetical protein